MGFTKKVFNSLGYKTFSDYDIYKNRDNIKSVFGSKFYDEHKNMKTMLNNSDIRNAISNSKGLSWEKRENLFDNQVKFANTSEFKALSENTQKGVQDAFTELYRGNITQEEYEKRKASLYSKSYVGSQTNSRGSVLRN